jgi:hypothetical protein
LLERLRLRIDAFHLESRWLASFRAKRRSRLKPSAIKEEAEEGVQRERRDYADEQPVSRLATAGPDR